MPKRLGKVVSRGADVGDSVIVSAKLADATIVSGDIAADTIGLSHMKEYHTSASMQALTSTISHNLGVDPSEVVITQLSSANLATSLYRGAVNQSQVTIAGNVSGAHFSVTVKA